jgi:hypothetical protein
MSALSKDASCITDFTFDRWYAGELSAAQQRELQTHLESCVHCSLRCEQLERQRAAFHRRAPDWQSFAARRTPARARVQGGRWRGPRWTVLGLAAAAALALFVVPTDHERTPAVRSKGKASIGFYVKRGEQVRRGASGERVRPGEVVRFLYSTERRAYFALLHADAARASVYFPSATHASLVAPGREVALDFAIRLDPMLGAERLYGLFCAEPVALEPLRAGLEAAGELHAVAGCQIDRIVLHKEPE